VDGVVRQVITDVREGAKTNQNPLVIIAEATNVDPAAQHALPSKALLKRQIKRIRKSESGIPAIPTSINELVIPDSFKRTLNNDNFLAYDSGPEDAERILIFTTAVNLDFLKKSSNWYVDGTFKASPNLFEQVLTVHARTIGGHVIPMVYTLLTSKKQYVYARFFKILKEDLMDNQSIVQTVIMDFEKALHNALTIVFVEAKVILKGCFFHFSQCLWRKIQSNGAILERYVSDPDFQLQLRLLAALAFVKKEDVITSWDRLIKSAFYTQNATLLEPMLAYFEVTWIGTLQFDGVQRHKPLFAHSTWNCFSAAEKLEDKTNNRVEGWHNSFNHLLECNNPTIFTFIEKLKVEQGVNELQIQHLLAGQLLPEGKKTYKDCALRIQSVVAQYAVRERLDYLLGIARNLQFQAN
jgi:hypothetical protein